MNNAGGLGLNGVDGKGQVRWDLLTNIKPFELERATSLKLVLDLWNIRKIRSTSSTDSSDPYSSRNGTLASSYLL